ncbi:MAG: hybrid sensor histidine kinase/response regulator [Caldilineaceae bacterium]|nr:hybrid sensor histidine kinase/response regulator [Caldilineaceae bacterium]
MNRVLDNHPSAARAALYELRQETFWWVLPGLYGAGFLLLALATTLPDPLQGGLPALLLFLLALLVWQIRPLHYETAVWTVIAGCLAVNLLLVVYGQLHATIFLFVLPIGLATYWLAIKSGIVAALLSTLFLWYAPAALRPFDPLLGNVTVVGMWGVVSLIWLTSYPLLTAIGWYWTSHEESRRALEQARDHQEQLGRLVADLADANLQLTRLHMVAAAMRQAAEDARTAKEQFVANVSHELRTPLNMIIGFSEMISQTPTLYGAALPPALLADLDVILRNSRHLSHLIDDVLDLSQIEAGQMALTKERVAVSDLITAATVAVRPLFAAKNLTLQADLPSDLPAIFCDRVRIRQVLLNLLSNAGRFTEVGGVQIRASQANGFVTIRVEDSGPGIPPELMQRLFQPFQQLDDALSRRMGGNGLGLSISKRFVDLHEGQMWVTSDVGVGTTFAFRLPVNPLASPAPGGVAGWLNPEWDFRQRTRPSTAPTATVQPRFVVLETADRLQRLLRRYLDQVEITAVRTLPEAIQAVTQTPAQALLINDLAWEENFQQLRDLAELPYGVPLLHCALPGDHAVADQWGLADYLVKPVARATLLAALERLPLPNRTILLVDDEPDALQLYRRMLASAEQPYRVLRASNGQEALELLTSQRPAALLLDLVMPKMDGFRLLAAKNQDPALRAIPTIVMTARDPAGQPIVSSTLTVTQQGGLSVAQLLACITTITELLAHSGQAGDLTSLITPAA